MAPFAELWISKIFACAGDADPGFAHRRRVGHRQRGVGGRRDLEQLVGPRRHRVLGGLHDPRARVRHARARRPARQRGPAARGGLLGGQRRRVPGDGTVNAEASAKNVITVGASEGVRPGGHGRLRRGRAERQRGPDRPVLQPRARPTTAASSPTWSPPARASPARGRGTAPTPARGELLAHLHRPRYSMASGTSQAAPAGRGRRGVGARWYLDNVGRRPPSPAMTKALLINTATDLAGGPGNTVAAQPTRAGGGSTSRSAFDSTPREYYDQQPVDLLEAGDTASARVRGPGRLQAREGHAGLDGPAGAGVRQRVRQRPRPRGRRRRADLPRQRLRRAPTRARAAPPTRATTSRACTCHRGPRALVRDGARDDRGRRRPQRTTATDQDFALVVSNATDQPAPQLVHQPTTIDDSARRRRRRRARVRRAGAAERADPQRRPLGLAGGSATLSGGAGLTVTQGTRPTRPSTTTPWARTTTPFGAAPRERGHLRRRRGGDAPIATGPRRRRSRS